MRPVGRSAELLRRALRRRAPPRPRRLAAYRGRTLRRVACPARVGDSHVAPGSTRRLGRGFPTKGVPAARWATRRSAGQFDPSYRRQQVAATGLARHHGQIPGTLPDKTFRCSPPPEAIMLRKHILTDNGQVTLAGDITTDRVNELAVRFFDGIGGASFFHRLATRFYELVTVDEELAGMFEKRPTEVHAQRLAGHFVRMYCTPDLSEGWSDRFIRAHDPAFQQPAPSSLARTDATGGCRGERTRALVLRHDGNAN